MLTNLPSFYFFLYLSIRLQFTEVKNANLLFTTSDVFTFLSVFYCSLTIVLFSKAMKSRVSYLLNVYLEIVHIYGVLVFLLVLFLVTFSFPRPCLSLADTYLIYHITYKVHNRAWISLWRAHLFRLASTLSLTHTHTIVLFRNVPLDTFGFRNRQLD